METERKDAEMVALQISHQFIPVGTPENSFVFCVFFFFLTVEHLKECQLHFGKQQDSL